MYFEDFQLGQKWETKGRTVTEADVVIFTGMTGALNPLFLDEEYGKRTRFKGRIVPGLLTASIAVGLTYQLPADPFGEGFVALAKLEFDAKRAVKIGDTLKCVVEVTDKKEREKDGRVYLMTRVMNQSGEEVMTLRMEIVCNKKG
ncbi:dehydratase [Sulfolobus sp. A20]|uniref:MaoC family dehydratase n=1 Tax=Sulfolobaceae TaxID=118883 RepID=UPI000845E742|nr:MULTISPECIES: MaoC/PaaZ C-terminal domain-containing protein [unclassified Sulfolobus]TRM76088.1 dehydratase [Sulfolobus sp. A20-N-F8]TRM77140.1 dehydratase [Sulfolobus sp. B5]TRM80966.1 dehydratase [Sulfolobus sp. D5]TRM84018.1 dehydratase [Sulfolobus sp. A20-N-F6]TRM88563.1 dehydratase [Sulfolobus sp. C3]TRM89129.1 dehydratase [Sulfolobus sp. E3]TRM94803.1 dehydratase [Sulfolobus sp. A20-N-G8]TRN02676.1 dehydratase [Sulfolobus sp. F1]TRN03152.1 dehydratase [Sulfolobus sp. E1]